MQGLKSIEEEVLTSAPRPQSGCFVCGPDHLHGLKLRFRTDGPGCVMADWVPGKEWEGYEGVIHGGIIATVLDEAMSKAIAAAAEPALTCRLEVRLRRHVAPGELIKVRGWVVEKRRRHLRVEAELRDTRNVERAHAWATFLKPQHSPGGRCLKNEKKSRTEEAH